MVINNPLFGHCSSKALPSNSSVCITLYFYFPKVAQSFFHTVQVSCINHNTLILNRRPNLTRHKNRKKVLDKKPVHLLSRRWKSHLLIGITPSGFLPCLLLGKLIPY